MLVASPGIKLNWAGVKGLDETLGRNGVTSNYLPHLAPYTHEMADSLRGGVRSSLNRPCQLNAPARRKSDVSFM